MHPPTVFYLKLIKRKVKKNITICRYKHTLGVEKTAIKLAKKYKCDVSRARIAALLHDCAKNISHNEKIKLCQEYNIKLNKEEMINPDLLHAKSGAILATLEYNITNKDILNAITYHTTGRPNMSLLEKIIYVADYIEPGRSEAKNLTVLRKLAMNDLDKALIKILKDTISYLKTKEILIDKKTESAYFYYTRR